MLGRLFGKNNDASDEPVCYQCGRTLLAGEWTQKIEGPDGEERLLCSLCRQSGPAEGGERLKVGNGGGNAARVGADDAAPAAEPPAAQRGENDALWKAIKDRDAQIEALTERLAHSEAERQELIGRLARMQAEAAAGVAAAAADAEPATEIGAAAEAEPPAATEPEAEAGEEPTAGETPAADEAEAPVPAEAHDEDEGDRLLLEDTAAIPAVGEAGEGAASPAPVDEAPRAAETAATPEPALPGDGVGRSTPDLADAEAQAASMTLLQRGVDLLNVSPVPRKIAETNNDLGIPNVHVGFDGETATVTFMWSMGWYRFAIDIESGSVGLGDRGYDDRTDLQPNASVRADGTVQLAAARISRAAAQRQQDAPPAAEPAAAVDEPGDAGVADAGPASPAEPGPPAGGPEILSKSLLGQRTDDERPSWEQTAARDFDWDR
jgi:hypothetical protein